jgi:predicted ATPase/DNA-binding SARP family transcriptional activator
VEGEAQIRLCGPLEVAFAGRRLEHELPSRQGRVLFAYLVLHRHRPVGRDELIEAVWSGGAPDAALLSPLLSRLRRALPAGTLDGRGQLRLRLPGHAWVDVEAVLAAPARARAAGDPAVALAISREALEIVALPLLPEIDRPWVDERRRALATAATDLLELVVRAALAAGEGAEAERAARRLMEREPLRESAHGLLMEVLAARGDVAQALQVYDELRTLLRDELGTVPGPRVRELSEQLLLHGGPRRRTRGVPSRTTPVFGREEDVRAVAALVEQARLVTLTGPGGVGKTTLALEVARRLAPRFGDGVCVAELAAVADPAEAPAAVALSLGVSPSGTESPRDALLRYAARREILLVLDNFEHLPQAAPLVAAILSAGPQPKILCTSRTPLRLSAERRYPVEPLPVPRSAALDGVASAQMFVDRARARDPAFRPGPAVATVCRRLGGLPLALELAAARIGFLTTDELAAGLDDALALLVGGPLDAPSRHQTLRATLDWSLRLLAEAEQLAFRRLAAFAGDAPLDAALAVTRADLLTLESLVNASLLTRVDGRLRLLEPVRRYAEEQLALDAGESGVRDRHAHWYRHYAEVAEVRLARAASRAALQPFDAEADNLRAALKWALASGDGELALALCCACGRWWTKTGQAAEARANIDAALALAGDDIPAQLRARTLSARADVWRRTPGAAERRRDDLEASLRVWEELGDQGQQADCLLDLSTWELHHGSVERAIERADAALALATSLGDDRLAARAQSARIAAEPDHPDAVAQTHDALTRLLAHEHLDDALVLTNVVGYASIVLGRFQQALDVLPLMVTVAETLDMPMAMFNAYGSLGMAQLFLGHTEEAADNLRRSLEVAREGMVEEIDEALLGLAAVAIQRGELERAALLTGAARVHTPSTLTLDEQRLDAMLRTEYLDPARRHLGAHRWDECARRGATFERAAAIELALSGEASSAARGAAPDPLSGR